MTASDCSVADPAMLCDIGGSVALAELAAMLVMIRVQIKAGWTGLLDARAGMYIGTEKSIR